MTLTEQIAEVLQAHMLEQWNRHAWWCSCGDDFSTTEDGHAQHVAPIIAELVVRLYGPPF